MQLYSVSGVITIDDRQIQQVIQQVEGLERSISEAMGRMSESVTNLGSTSILKFTNSYIRPAIGGITELTTALIAYRAAKQTLKGVTQAATAVQAAQNAVFKANPFGLVLTGVVALYTVIATLVRRNNEATEAARAWREESEKLIRSAEEFGERTRENSETIAATTSRIRELIMAIAALYTIEGKTDEQRAELLTNVDLLNQAFPGLLLNYDLENDTLNKTIDTLHHLNDARDSSEQYWRALYNIEHLLGRIGYAQEVLTLRLHDQHMAVNLAKYGFFSFNEIISRIATEALHASGCIEHTAAAIAGMSPAVRLATTNVANARAGLEDYQRQLDEARAVAQQHSETQVQMANDTAASAREIEQAMGIRASQGLTRYTYTLNQATSSADRLNRAQNELNDTSQLSINTITDMITNGYALALRINAETGAVTLCTDAYLRLANARIDELILDKESSRLERIKELGYEADVIKLLSDTIDDNTRATINNRLAQYEGIAGYDAQIAGLRNLRTQLGQTAQATRGAASASATAARDRVTAEREAFNAINAYLERRIFFEDITAKEIYEIRKNSLEQFVGDVEVMEKAERELFTARNNLENDYLSNRQRIFGLHEDALERMKAAEQRFADAVNNRAQAIFNSALRMASIDRLLIDSTEERANAVVAATDSIAAAQRRLADLEASEARNTQQRNHAIAAAQERYEAARVAFAEASAEDRVAAERRVAEALWALEDARAAKDADRTARLEEIELLEQQIYQQGIARAEAEYQAQKTHAQLIAESLQETIDNMREHSRMMNHILNETEISKDFLAEMGLLEPGAVHELSVLYNSCEEELAEIADLFGKMQKLARDRAEEELQGMREDVNQEIKSIYEELNKTINTEAPETGANMVLGMIEGVNDNINELMDTMRNMMDDAFDAAKDAAEINSPSRKFAEIGKNSVLGMIEGFRGKERGLYNVLMDIMRRITNCTNNFLRNEGFVAGRSFASELGQGLMSQQAGLLAQAMAQAEAIRAAFAPTPTIPSVGGFQAAGSFAHGLDFVPYDNFPAYLHRGEMVLTSRQADEYRNESGGKTFIQNFYGVQERETGYKAYRGYQKAQALLGV